MCGVFAALTHHPTALKDSEEIKILSLLRHRGPDGTGVARFPGAGLLHTRLSIVDLTPSGSQPMASEDGRWQIIFNGECYNHKNLRKELAGKGVQFRSRSDTEVLLHAFLVWGHSFIHRVNGIFSIVIYDSVGKIAYFWRDRLGVKPLYWTKTNAGFYLSSEIKPLLQFQDAALNDEALTSYFQLRYVVGTKTMFKNIFECPPGHMGHASADNCEFTPYWSLTDHGPDEEINEREHRHQLFELLEDSVRLESLADVGVNGFLSGGVDSAVITALSRKSNPNFRTFTLATGLGDDESERALKIARYLEVAHEIVAVSKQAEDYRHALYHLEDPLGDSILTPTLDLMKAAATANKVVLSGEGADEIFSGYAHQQALTFEDQWIHRLPVDVLQFFARCSKHIPQFLWESVFPYPGRLGQSGREQVLAHLNSLGSEFERVESLISLFQSPSSQAIFAAPLQNDTTRSDYWNALGEMPFADKLKRLDLRFWTSRYTLHRLDRLSMSQSLEARVPYFDHRIVEHMLKMPVKKVFSFRDPKRHFRNSLPTKLLPQEVIWRKKQAFQFPLDKAFSSSQIRDMEMQILENAPRRGIYDRRKLEEFLLSPQKELLYFKQLQVLFNFEIWNQIFIDK